MTTPPPPPPAAAAGQNRSVMWGVLGIIVGLLCCGILGVIFGALSLRDAGRYGTSRTLGYIAIAVSVLNILTSASLTATGNWPWQT